MASATIRDEPRRDRSNLLLTRASHWLDPHLLRFVDLGLAGVIFLAPLFMGGRHPLGELVYVALVCGTACAWALRQLLASESRWQRSSGAEWLLLAGFVLIVVQIMPLPSALLSRLSPGQAGSLPLWSAEASGRDSLGTWASVSLTPEATRGALTIFAANAMLFLVVVQRIRQQSDIERLLRWIALAAVGMALLGLAQFLLSNGKFLWLYEHPYRETSRSTKGPFINENHYAHFLALGVAPVIWWLQRSLGGVGKSGRGPSRPGRRQRHHKRSRGANTRSSAVRSRFGAARDAGRKQAVEIALATALGLIALAGLLTFSRGGVIAIFLASAVCVSVYARRKLLGRRALVALGAVGLLVGAALLVYGYEPLAKQLGSLSSGSLDEIDHNDARRKLWRADLQAVAQAPVLGHGGGSHIEVYPTYYEEHTHVEYTHAESGYLQVLVESGIVGLTLALLAVVLVGYWCFRTLWSSRSSTVTACGAAIAAGLVASLIHSIWDFVWYIPACFSLTVILSACACRLYQITRSTSEPEQCGLPRLPATTALFTQQRISWAVALLVVGGTSFLLIQNRGGPALAATAWQRFLIYEQTEELADDDGTSSEDATDLRMRLIGEVLQHHPNDPRANLAMASLCLLRFDEVQQFSENPLPLTQIRDAVRAGGFATDQARSDWLNRVIGPNRVYLDRAQFHARRAAELSPLQGEAYVYLADLAFLSGADRRETALLDQALRVRPHRGAVLMAAGNHAALNDNTDAAIRSWREAFHQDPRFQTQLIQMLAPRLSASFMLKEFEPDLTGMRSLYRFYQTNKLPDQAREVAVPLVGLLESHAKTVNDEQAAKTWHEAYRVHVFLEDRGRALHCICRAVDSDPTSYPLHRGMGNELFVNGRFKEAAEAFTWCLRRKPDDDIVRRQLAAANRQDLVTSPVAEAIEPPAPSTGWR